MRSDEPARPAAAAVDPLRPAPSPSRVPFPVDARRLASRIGASGFERSLVVIVGGFELCYSLQTLDSFAADWPSMSGPLGAVAAIVLALGVLLGIVAAVLPSAARRLSAAAAAAYAAGALIWPFALHGPVPADPMPWFVAMWIAPLGALVVASRRPAVPLIASAVVAAHLTAVLLAVGGSAVPDAVSSGVFALALSAVLVALVTAIRRAVDRADVAQRSVLEQFARSSADDAAEAERVRTDALVHDSVLTTLLTAAAAQTPESEDLTRRMAANALRVLSHVTRSAAHGPVVALPSALADVEPELALLRGSFDVRIEGVDDLVLPAGVADAVLGAMLQAMSNSVRHAGAGVPRSVRMTRLGPDGLRIVVEDLGVGFDPAAPSDRLGLRLSIRDRMRRIDGRADVESAPGRGCRVALSWGSVVVFGTEPLEDDAAAVPA